MAKQQPKATPARKVSTLAAPASPTAPPRTYDAWLVALVTFAVFALTIGHDFVNWDDDLNIYENPNLRVFGWQYIVNIFSVSNSHLGNYNPLPIFTFYVEKLIAGKHSPGLIHFNNAWLHALTAVFAHQLLRRMGIGRTGALVGGLLFGLHPMRVESVAWATERKDVLFGVFYFAALGVYARWVSTAATTTRRNLYLAMVGLAVLSLFSKVQAVSLPLSMLVLDYWFKRPLHAQRLVEKAPFWVLSLLFGLLNVYSLRQAGALSVGTAADFSLGERLCIGAYSLLVYLYKVVLPYPMSPLYPYPKVLSGIMYAAPLVVLALLYGLYRLWRADQRVWVFGALFFLVNIVFLLQVVGAGQGFLADRFTYVAYFGWFAVAAWYVSKATETGTPLAWVRPLAWGALAMYAGWSLWQISTVWKNGETLWSHVIDREGDRSGIPYVNRGQYYRTQGKIAEALADYNKAAAVDPQNPDVFTNQGKTYFDLAVSGQGGKEQRAAFFQQALASYDRGLALPNIPKEVRARLLINRGATHAALRNVDAALRDLTEGLQLDPTNKSGFFNRGLLYAGVGQHDLAATDFTTFLGLDAYHAPAYYERGVSYRALQRWPEAIADQSKALQLQPNNGAALLERARAYAAQGNVPAAKSDYRAAQQLGKVRFSETDQAWLQQH